MIALVVDPALSVVEFSGEDMWTNDFRIRK